MEPLVIRADASTQIGIGHLMRCLALAQAWKDAGCKVIFITACQSEELLQRLREEGFDIHLLGRPYPDPSDWDSTKDVLASHPNAWVVLDGYHLDETYQQKVKEAGHRLLVVDDMAHLKHYYADIVLNQNLHAEQLHYSCEPYTRLLLGTRYVLLRREFLDWRNWKREIPEVVRHVLVTLGSSDPENHTLKVIQALQKVQVTGLEVVVVVGACNPNADVLEAAIVQNRIPVRLIRNATNMPELMAWADLAATAAGSTVWELCLLKVPTIAGVTVGNHRDVASALSDIGAVRNVGWIVERSIQELAANIDKCIQDSALRKSMSESMAQVVDGEGAERVVNFIGVTWKHQNRLKKPSMDSTRS